MEHDGIMEKISPTINNIDNVDSAGSPGGYGGGFGGFGNGILGGLLAGALFRRGGFLGGDDGVGAGAALLGLNNAINGSTNTIVGNMNSDNLAQLQALSGLGREVCAVGCNAVSAVKDNAYAIAASLNAGVNNLNSNITSGFNGVERSLCAMNTTAMQNTNAIVNKINECCAQETTMMSALNTTLVSGVDKILCAINDSKLQAELACAREQLNAARMREVENTTVARTTEAVAALLSKLSPCVPKNS